MTNFQIHESDWTKDFYTNYNQIKQDLSNGMKIKDIRTKYGLTKGKWGTYRKELIQEGLLKPRTKIKEDAKFYTAYRNRFHVQKIIDGKKYHIGTFRTEAQAKYCVRLMRECDWDLNELPRIKKEIQS